MLDRLHEKALYGGRRRRCKSGREGTDWLLSLKARVLLAAVSLTAAWQRNLFHSKRCLNGTANSATTCRWQAASARQRRIQQGPDARSSSQSVPHPKYRGSEKDENRKAMAVRVPDGRAKSEVHQHSACTAPPNCGQVVSCF